MPTLIYNENSYVRWDKTECDNYTITNLLDYSAVNVVMTDLTSDWKEEFVLQVGDANEVVVPGDGVYKICAVAEVGGEVDPFTANPLSYTQSLVNIGQLNAQPDADEAQMIQINVVGVGPIYWSSLYGGTDTPYTWVNPPSSYAGLIALLNAWLTANGGGWADIIAPGQTSPNFPWVEVDNEDYQLAFISLAGFELENVITAQDQDTSPVFHQPDIDCVTSWAPDLENLDPVRNYAVSWILDGENIIPNPIDVSTPEGVDLLFATVQQWLDANGGGGIINRENLWFVFENCATPGPLTLANVLPSEEECDYIYEFCDTYACITRLMTQWLCNPCPDKCDPNYVDSVDARNRAIELSTLFFHALMPLVAQDRMWYLGNWNVNDNRTCNVNEIVDLYKHLREFLKSCGFNCCDPCKSGCKCSKCDPLNSKYPVNNSNSDCGCNK
jgi:hypothetical protein